MKGFEGVMKGISELCLASEFSAELIEQVSDFRGYCADLSVAGYDFKTWNDKVVKYIASKYMHFDGICQVKSCNSAGTSRDMWVRMLDLSLLFSIETVDRGGAEEISEDGVRDMNRSLCEMLLLVEDGVEQLPPGYFTEGL